MAFLLQASLGDPEETVSPEMPAATSEIGTCTVPCSHYGAYRLGFPWLISVTVKDFSELPSSPWSQGQGVLHRGHPILFPALGVTCTSFNKMYIPAHLPQVPDGVGDTWVHVLPTRFLSPPPALSLHVRPLQTMPPSFS